PGVVAEALDEAAAADLVHTGPVQEFVHEIVRDAMYDELPSAHRTHWHHAVAARLAATPNSDPGDVAFHYRLAGPAQAEQWLRWAWVPGRPASRWRCRIASRSTRSAAACRCCRRCTRCARWCSPGCRSR